MPTRASRHPNASDSGIELRNQYAVCVDDVFVALDVIRWLKNWSAVLIICRDAVVLPDLAVTVLGF